MSDPEKCPVWIDERKGGGLGATAHRCDRELVTPAQIRAGLCGVHLRAKRLRETGLAKREKDPAAPSQAVRKPAALSGLLGELAVKTAALKEAEELLEHEERGDPDYLPREGLSAEVLVRIRSALASDSGRLAGELIRAAVLVFDEGPRSEFNGRSATGIKWFDEMLDDLGSKADALLAAFPAIREEVER